MKYLLFSAYLFAAVACNNKSGALESANPTAETVVNPLQEEFSKLVTSIANGDKHTLKQFIKFPFSNPQGANEIWFVGQIEDADGEKPFTEADFDANFTILFANEARPIFKDIDVESFFATNTFSKELAFEKNRSKTVNIDFDKTENIIDITIIDTTKFELTAEDANEPDSASSAVIYKFKVINNTLQLQGVYTAG